jgi:hypothetical protein
MSLGMDADAIQELTERYARLGQGVGRRYNEAQTRKDFIDPLFASLGWDVRGVERSEVDVETRVSGGRADYAFKVDGVVRFYLEAKKLEEDLYNPDYAKQVMTYAYNKGVPWAVLSNFARLQVFNAEWETDDLNRARFLDLTWEDYARADSPLVLLSREAFVANELDKRAQTYGGMRPRQPVEKSLYAQMRQWRERLFNEIARMRPDLTLEQVDEVIERLLNRLIFIRNCEDRKVEAADLRAALHQWQRPGRRAGLTEAVRAIFASFDATFDSDLFALHLVDQLLPSGTDLEDALGDIVAGLYAPPRSLAAYDFAVIDADVLGQVYEQYLGHVAQVLKEEADKRERQLALGIEVPRIQLEAKRQRRKERGIYYTPKWVVDHIVRQTVGRYLEEHTYNDVLNVKILDPACGSGSFLIRAFDVLLEYHAKVKGKAVAELDQYDRLPTLTANIFGVDLDQRAVDIARLNLLLRAVARRELLPSLERNIVRGNSLISGSEEELRPYFGDTWREKQPFDWQREFPDVMDRGGFDIIIGNPPYVGFHGFEKDKPYLRDNYETAQSRFDLYIPFVERAYQLLRAGGLFGFICPTNFMKRQHGGKLRDLLRTRTALLNIHDFRDLQAFEGPLNYTGIVVFRKAKPDANHRVGYSFGDLNGPAHRFLQADLGSATWVFRDRSTDSIISRMLSARVETLGAVAEAIAEGVVTGKNRVFLVSKDDIEKYGIEADMLRKAIRGRHVKRYTLEWDGTYLIYPHQSADDSTSAIPEETLRARFPKAHKYLLGQRPSLSGRGYFERSPKAWYELWCARDIQQQAALKIITPELADSNRFALAPADYFYLDTACGITLRPGVKESPLYLLGLLNSPLIQYFYRQTTVPKANGFLIYKTMYLKNIPIRRIDFASSTDKRLHDHAVALVKGMLALHERLAAKGDMRDEERVAIEREIERTDREIDGLVYDLYGLTQEERRLVEEEMGR